MDKYQKDIEKNDPCTAASLFSDGFNKAEENATLYACQIIKIQFKNIYGKLNWRDIPNVFIMGFAKWDMPWPILV